MVLDDRPTEELADAIEQMHGIHAAAHQRMLDFIAAYDERGAWQADGSTSMAPWLVFRFALPFAQASDWVRVAKALRDLPIVRAAFAEGRLGFELVALITKVASKEDEAELVEHIKGNARQRPAF